MTDSRKPPRRPAFRGRLPESGPPVQRSESTPPPVRPAVVKSAARSAGISEGKGVPTGKVASSRGPEIASSQGQSSASSYARRQKSTPLGAWLGMVVGLVAVMATFAFLIVNFGTDDPPRAKKKSKPRKVASVVDKKSDDSGKGDDAKDAAGTDLEEKSSTETGTTETGTTDQVRSTKPEAEKPSDTPTEPTEPTEPALPKLTKYRTIDEVPVSQMPAALETRINEAIALAKGGEFDKLLSEFVDPLEASMPRRRNRARSPQDLLGDGEPIAEVKTLAALQAITTRKPHLFDDGNLALFSLSDKTLPTFVKRENIWYLSSGRGADIFQRLRTPTGVDRLIYHLDRLTGKKAISAREAKPNGDQQELITRLLDMGAEVAVNGPGDQIRTAVLLLPGYSGGDEGLKILSKLINLEVLIFDGTGSFTDTGLMELDSIQTLRHVEFLSIRNAQAITIYFLNMENLDTLRIEAKVTDRDLTHLMKLFKLKRLSIRSRDITDEGIEQLGNLPQLEVVSLTGHEGAVTEKGVGRLRQLLPKAWIDW